VRLTERTIDAQGQLLIEPKLTLDGWTTSLSAKQFDAKAIIALYADHGTHEQFHSEFKTDLDLERLPSGQVRHQLPGVRLGGTGHEHPAPDGPGRLAGARRTGAPRCQTQAHQDRDAGTHLSGGSPD